MKADMCDQSILKYTPGCLAHCNISILMGPHILKKFEQG
jgi:hypothetical protein